MSIILQTLQILHTVRVHVILVIVHVHVDYAHTNTDKEKYSPHTNPVLLCCVRKVLRGDRLVFDQVLHKLLLLTYNVCVVRQDRREKEKGNK